MKRSVFLVLGFATACGSRPAVTAVSQHVQAHAAPVAIAPPSAACLDARDARAKAEELDRGGHEILALAAIDEANAACPAERGASAAIEARLRASRAAGEAASSGTPASARAKMHEADTAERAKDWARAKTLYLAAWTEHHPNPRALESAARVASLAGDPAEARRLRDRALLEAEATDSARPVLTERVRATHGSARLVGTTLLLAQNGKVVARDTTTGEPRVLVDAKTGGIVLSPHGTLAFATATPYAKFDTDPRTLSVFDVLTGELLFKVDRALRFAASPDDSRVAVRVSGTKSPDDVRVYDVATGNVVAKIAVNADYLAFTRDASHLLTFDNGASTNLFVQWAVDDKGAATRSSTLQNGSSYATAAMSANGRYFAFLDGILDAAVIRVRDMVEGKELAQLSGKFHSVEGLAIANDGKSVATGSFNSLRIWDVASKKQLYKTNTSQYGGNVTDSRDPNAYAFSDDGKTLLLAGDGLPTAWDVATGADKSLVTEQPTKKVLRVVPAPDGVAIVLEDEVRIVKASGEPKTVCRGMKPLYHDIIGPTNVAFSPSGKSFACAMSDGWVHVLDASTWAERTVIKKSLAAPPERPVDLLFSPDEKTITVFGDAGFVEYDAASGARGNHVWFRHPNIGLAPRHARFDDGTLAARTWTGAIAIYGADGAWQRDVKLPPAVPLNVLDAFSPGGSTYAFATHKTLHVIDLASGAEQTVTLPSDAKSLSIARDGKTFAVTGADHGVTIVTGTIVTPLAGATGVRAWIAGKTVLVARADDTLAAFAIGGAPGPVLEIDPDGVVASDAAGFEVRGKPEVECAVGKTLLARETCADLEKSGTVATFVSAVK